MTATLLDPAFFRAADSWFILSLQLTPENCMVAIPLSEFNRWDDRGQGNVRAGYKAITTSNGMFVKDPFNDRIWLGPVSYFHSERGFLYGENELPLLYPNPAGTPPNPSNCTSFMMPNAPAGARIALFGTADPAHNPGMNSHGQHPTSGPATKIPRPPNAFIIYRKHHHSRVVAQNPGTHNNIISQIIGKMWAAEDATVRANYKAQADLAKAEHVIKHPDYQYKPRKPSEKKRRMTKKKAEVARNLATSGSIPPGVLTSTYAAAESISNIKQPQRRFAGPKSAILPLSEESKDTIEALNTIEALAAKQLDRWPETRNRFDCTVSNQTQRADETDSAVFNIPVMTAEDTRDFVAEANELSLAAEYGGTEVRQIWQPENCVEEEDFDE